MDGMDKNKTFLIVGLGLLGGKYAQVLSQKGYRVTGITHSQSTLDYALEHAYICEGRNENFDDLVQNADYIIFGLYPTVLLEWVKQYGHLVRPGTLITDVSGVKRGVVEPVQQMLPEGVEFTPTEGGMFLWAKLPNGMSAVDLYRVALAKGVAICPGDPFYEKERNVSTFRINYSNSSDEVIEKGIRILGEACAELIAKKDN